MEADLMSRCLHPTSLWRPVRDCGFQGKYHRSSSAGDLLLELGDLHRARGKYLLRRPSGIEDVAKRTEENIDLKPRMRMR